MGRVDSSRALRLVYQPLTILFVVLGWVLFRSANLAAAGQYLSAMFGAGAPLVDGPFVFWSREVAVPFVVAVVGSTPLLKRISAPAIVVVGYVLQFALFVLSISCLVMNAHNPFIYFNF